MNLSANFYDYEFRCKCGCGQLKMHPGFVDRLQLVRNDVFAQARRGMTVLSGGRCKAHNERPAAEGGAGGHPRSLHVLDYPQHPGQYGCLAADIEAIDGHYRGVLFSELWAHGFSIGWNKARGFLHADLRVLLGLPQQTFDY